MKKVFYIQKNLDKNGFPCSAKAIAEEPLGESSFWGDGAVAHAIRQLMDSQRYLEGWDVIRCDFPNGQEMAMVIEENGAINSIYISMEVT